LPVSAGWIAGVRHKAAVRLEPFLDHVRGLLRQAGVIYGRVNPNWPHRSLLIWPRHLVAPGSEFSFDLAPPRWGGLAVT